MHKDILSTFMNKELIDKYMNFLLSRPKNPKGYSEVHHIIPKCKGGDNSEENLIVLEAKDHFTAHKILSLSGDTQMYSAFSMMMKGRKNQDWFTKEMYEECREAAAISCGERFRGIKLSKEHRDKIGKASKGRKYPNRKSPPSRSEESRQKTSKSHTGMKRSEEAKNNISEAKKNPSKETRQRISEGAKRRFSNSEERDKLSIVVSKRNKGRFWINNKLSNKFVNELTKELRDLGYVKGRIMPSGCKNHKNSELQK